MMTTLLLHLLLIVHHLSMIVPSFSFGAFFVFSGLVLITRAPDHFAAINKICQQQHLR